MPTTRGWRRAGACSLTGMLAPKPCTAARVVRVGPDAVQRFETALVKARRAMASREFEDFFVTLDLTECLNTQSDAFDALCLVQKNGGRCRCCGDGGPGSAVVGGGHVPLVRGT